MELISLKSLARVGAPHRLEQIEEERVAIFREFPDLRPQVPRSRPASKPDLRPQVPRPRTANKPVRSRPRVSAAARKVASKRMRKYWAERRKKDSKKR